MRPVPSSWERACNSHLISGLEDQTPDIRCSEATTLPRRTAIEPAQITSLAADARARGTEAGSRTPMKMSRFPSGNASRSNSGDNIGMCLAVPRKCAAQAGEAAFGSLGWCYEGEAGRSSENSLRSLVAHPMCVRSRLGVSQRNDRPIVLYHAEVERR
ncbi:hypothetical protein BV25DRAFT_1322661 [Artomyces pyxidatus]|uniref:Uncharacterized protein n=1 Tax=Artomyces pyxidatus TaxID=48021 RepID=A0ACB8SNI4_9AGAM|nr:hypothetical protein BV25DRAFT_1322661 [Artomyces pyxidatus]